MPTRTWVGTTDGNWATASNWDETTVPINGDDVYIVSGSADIDGSDQSAVTLGRLVVGTQYTGNIGTSDTKLQISATDFDYASNGATTYIEGTFVTLTVQNTSSDSNALNLYGSSDTITKLRILGGKGGINIDSSVEFDSSSIIEQIGAGGVTTNIADGTTVHANCTLTMDSGKLELNQAVSTVTIFGGELLATLDSGTVTDLDIYGGRVRWTPTASCTITNLNLYSGLFDSRDSIAPAFTITNTTIHENGTLDERSGLENATYTSINLEGGEIKYDTGRSVTIN